MERSYTKNYIKIYTAEVFSILLGIVSLFVVVPFISDNKEIYGVYSLCLSTMIFLSYADLGFLGASLKFAAEYYQKGEKNNEIEVLAFGGFVLFAIAALISLCFLALSFNPGWVITGIDESPYIEISKKLFAWMAVLSPFVGLQRLSQCIYSIRIENYIYQLINIIGSLLRIGSVFVFFSNGRYEIVEYFVFMQIVPILCSAISFWIVKYRYKYDLLYLLKSFRWNVKCYKITKDLATSSFFVTLSWILYYELDQIAIAKMYGANQVALYAIAFALLNYIRMFQGGFFSPFTPRFAHFRADNDLEGLSKFFKTVTNIAFPLVACPIITTSFMVRPFVIAWSGPQYVDAVLLAAIFVLINIFSSFSYTGGSIITVFEKTNTLKIMALVLPAIYWIGIIVLPNNLSILSFGIMKAVVFFLTVVVYGYISFQTLHLSLKKYFVRMVSYNIWPILLVCILSYFASRLLVINEKGIVPLIIVCSAILTITIVAYCVELIFNPIVKNYFLGVFNKIYASSR